MALLPSRLPAAACFMVVSLIAVCRGAPAPRRSFIAWSDLNVAKHYPRYSDVKVGVDDGGRVISVSKDGAGDATTVQRAVDMIPEGNTGRVKILISPGVYREKVVVPKSKPFISFIGDGTSDTVISFHLRASDQFSNGVTVGTYDSATVAVESDFFCANGITFENTAPAAKPGEEGMQAVALRLSGDKAMLYRCRILGTQDTLFDHVGRHYFFQCYIQGSIDFIFGSARSLYEGCKLHAVAESYGAVAASQRNSPLDNSGFSFIECSLNGTGMLYLGRAWGRYARVVYSYCQLEGIILPEGWSDWGDPSRTSTAYFGQFNCNGEGADLRGRVPWARSLTYEEAKPFLDRGYVDGDQWLSL